jgi:hypothetical protein
VLDLLRAWLPPFSPSGVIADIVDLLRPYGITTTMRGDRYAPGFVSECYRTHGIRYEPSPLDRSALYLELLPLVNSGHVRLLDQPELLRELRNLERCRGISGRDRVDHAPGAHDDRANACAGALVEAMQAREDERRRATVKWALALNRDEDGRTPCASFPMASDSRHRPW